MRFPAKTEQWAVVCYGYFCQTVQTSLLTNYGPQFREEMFTYVSAFFQTQQLFVSVFFSVFITIEASVLFIALNWCDCKNHCAFYVFLLIIE